MNTTQTFSTFDVGGTPGGEAYLLDTGRKAALIDSGFSFSAPNMIRKIKSILGDRPLDYVLLTHSHYDHASGSIACKKEWPNAQIASSAYAAQVFQKPGAKRVIKEMNQNAAAVFGFSVGHSAPDELHSDLELQDGDNIDLNPATLTVLDAPGHTKCSIAFWCPQEEYLISCETMGVPAGGDIVMPAYLTGYQTSVDFIRRAKNLRPKHILIPHIGVFHGADCTNFIDRALYWNQKAMDMICRDHASGRSVDEIILHFKHVFYTEPIRRIQPEAAFDLNAAYLVPMVLKECS